MNTEKFYQVFLRQYLLSMQLLQIYHSLKKRNKYFNDIFFYVFNHIVISLCYFDNMNLP